MLIMSLPDMRVRTDRWPVRGRKQKPLQQAEGVAWNLGLATSTAFEERRSKTANLSPREAQRQMWWSDAPKPTKTGFAAGGRGLRMVAWRPSSATEKTCIWWAEATRSRLEVGAHWRDVTGPEKSRGKSMSLTVCRFSTARMCSEEADSVATSLPLGLGAQWGEAITDDQRPCRFISHLDVPKDATRRGPP